MLSLSRAYVGGWVLVTLGAVVACGGDSKSDDDDSSSAATAGKSHASGAGGGSNAGTTSSKGGTSSASGGTGGSKGGTTSAAGTGGSPPRGGTGGTGGAGAGGPINVVEECPAFTPCGGNVVGTWRLTTACGSSAVSMGGTSTTPSCGTTSDEMASGDLIYTFTADGTLTISGLVTVGVTVSLDDACAMTTYGTDAATACLLLQTLGSSGTSGDIPISVDCSSSAGVCKCAVDEGPAPADRTATYTTSGTELTADGAASAYCVDDDTLTVKSATNDSLSILTRQ